MIYQYLGAVEVNLAVIALDTNWHLTYCVNSDESKLKSEFMYL